MTLEKFKQECNVDSRASQFAWTRVNQDWKQQLEILKGSKREISNCAMIYQLTSGGSLQALRMHRGWCSDEILILFDIHNCGGNQGDDESGCVSTYGFLFRRYKQFRHFVELVRHGLKPSWQVRTRGVDLFGFACNSGNGVIRIAQKKCCTWRNLVSTLPPDGGFWM